MTPGKRLNQLEPVLADFVQKVDRLIQGNGQIIHKVSKISGIERTVAITAKGLAELTVNVQHLTVNINQRFDQFQQELSDVKSDQQLILQILREKLH